MRKFIRVVSIMLMLVGLLFLGDAAMNKWGSGEVITGAIANRNEKKLEQKFEQEIEDNPTLTSDKQYQTYINTKVKIGEPIMRIKIPAIGLNTVVVKGVTTMALSKGPGWMTNTGRLGQRKRIALAGHRTTWTKPFHDVDKLQKGNSISLTARGHTVRYTVVRQFRVLPSQTEVLKGTGLILITCDPPGSAAYRRIVLARQSS
jgi:sortase A